MSEPAQGASAPASKPSRAGRNVPVSIAVGVTLIAVVVASLFIVKVAFLGVVLLAAMIALWEFSNALSTSGIRIPIVPVALGGLVILVGSYAGGVEAVGVASALTVIGTLIWRLAEGADGFVRDVSAGIFTIAYIPILGSFVPLMLHEDDGPWRIVAFVGCTVASDTGGFVAGVLAGRHPMAPTISPKKSWEGFCGSLILGMAAGAVAVRYGLDGPWWVGIVLGAAVVVMATLGDLSESLVKRDLGIKDMGNLLPGHGGIMDRLDSLLVVAPVCWLILHLLVEA